MTPSEDFAVCIMVVTKCWGCKTHQGPLTYSRAELNAL